MTVKYLVTVKRITEEVTEEKRWVKVADTGNKRDGGPQYDYAPPTVVREQKEKEVLNAEVDDLSLPALTALLYPPEKRKHRAKTGGTT